MDFALHRKILLYKQFQTVIVILLAAVFLSRCGKGYDAGPDHTAKVDSIMGAKQYPKMVNPRHYLDSSYRTFTPGLRDRFKELNTMRDFYTTAHNYDSALVYADSMLLTVQPAFDAGSFNDEYIKALFFKGDALMATNRFYAALETYYKAKTIMTGRMKLTQLYYGYYDRLAYSFYKQDNFEEAAKNYKLAVEATVQEKDPFTKFVYTQMFLDDIGLCYSYQGLTDSALHYYNAALSYINGAAPTFKNNVAYLNAARGVVYGNIAPMLEKKGNDSLAEKYMRESIRTNSTPPYSSEDAQYTRERLAEFYLKKGREAGSLSVLAEMKNWLDSNKGTNHAGNYYRLLARAFEKNGLYKQADESINAYLAIDDSTDERIKRGNKANIVHQLDFMERTSQLAQAQADQERQKTYTIIAIGCLAMAMVIVVLVTRNYRQSGKNVKRLTELNNQVRQKNSQLQTVLEALEKSHNENTRMMKIIAHDLRSPVGAMLSFTEMQMSEGFTEEEKIKMLPLLQKSGKGALMLIEELLYSNASANELAKEDVELGDLLQYCADQLQPKANEKSQHILIAAQKIHIKADRAKLWRVFANLITNAIKFSPVNAAIKIKVYTEDAAAVVAVEDNGIGIPEEIRPEIFEITSQVRRKGTDNEPSFGLGLYISRQIVEAHGGKIWFENPPTGGSIFYVSLPTGA